MKIEITEAYYGGFLWRIPDVEDQNYGSGFAATVQDAEDDARDFLAEYYDEIPLSITIDGVEQVTPEFRDNTDAVAFVVIMTLGAIVGFCAGAFLFGYLLA